MVELAFNWTWNWISAIYLFLVAYAAARKLVASAMIRLSPSLIVKPGG